MATAAKILSIALNDAEKKTLQVRNNTLAKVFDTTSTCVADVMEAGFLEDHQLTELKICMETYAKLDFQMEAHAKALQMLKKEVGQNITDIRQRFEQSVQQEPVKNFDTHYKYIEFEELLKSSEKDDDIEMTNDVFDPKCPITMQIFKNPMKSKICKHTFSHEGITMLLRKEKSINCPRRGCLEKITKADIVEDKEAARNVEKYLREQRENQDE
eukprot:m.120007 g.120007  ORF g.120007 m.120007 type:complete len:214 (-) comp28780_c1_seq1:446-1087(-)